MRRLLTCAVTLACGCAHPRTASDSRPAYLELESAHYVLLTDLPERDAGKTLDHLENVRGALIQGSWHGDALSGPDAHLVILSGQNFRHDARGDLVCNAILESVAFVNQFAEVQA